jgi:hypothetical protein
LSKKGIVVKSKEKKTFEQTFDVMEFRPIDSFSSNPFESCMTKKNIYNGYKPIQQLYKRYKEQKVVVYERHDDKKKNNNNVKYNSIGKCDKLNRFKR